MEKVIVKKTESNKEFCFAMILLLANRFQTKLDKYTGELTLKQWLLLCMLSNMNSYSVSVNDLSAVVGYSRQNIKKMVDILVQKEYLQLKESAKDKRAYQIGLTEKAHQFFTDFENLGEKILTEIFNGIDDEALTNMGCVMEKIANNVDAM